MPEDDSQPNELGEELLESYEENCHLPKVIPLMSLSEKLQLRTVKQVLRYHVPNEQLYPEKYAHHLLYLFYPFRREEDLKHNGSYCSKLAVDEVLEVVNVNRKVFEPHEQEINCVFNHIQVLLKMKQLLGNLFLVTITLNLVI